MTTKDDFLFLKDKTFIKNNSFSNAFRDGGAQKEYSNLNLNQNFKNSNVSFIQSKSNSNFIDKQQHFATVGNTDSTVSQNNETNLKFFNKKSSSNFCSKNFNSLNGKIKDENEIKKSSKNKDSLNFENSSTLSLHISAYENSVEISNSDSSKNENKSFKNESSSIKKSKNAKQIFDGLSSAIQNPFEFPRQQSGNQQITNPEVRQFRASQRLFNPNMFRGSHLPRYFNMMSRFPPPSRPPLQQQPQQQPSEKALRSVYVGNIAFDVNEEELKQTLAKIGPVIGFRIVHDRETGKSKGFGFCEYLDPETANRCIRQLNNLDFKGRNLRIDSAVLNERAMNDDFASSSQNPMSSSFRPRSPHDETSMYGPSPLNGKTPEAIAKTLSKCSPEIMFEVMRDMKNLATTNPQRCRQLLETNQQLAFALLQAQVMMHWLDTDAAFNLIDRKPAQEKAAEPPAPVQEPQHAIPTRQPLRPTPTQVPPPFRPPPPQQQQSDHQFFQHHTPPLPQQPPQQQHFRQQFFPPPQQQQQPPQQRLPPPSGAGQWPPSGGPPPQQQQQRMPPPPPQHFQQGQNFDRFPPPLPSSNDGPGFDNNYRNNFAGSRPPLSSNFHNMPPQRFPPHQQQSGFRPPPPPQQQQQHFQQSQRRSNDTTAEPEVDAEDYEMIEELLQLSEEQVNQLPPIEAAKIREIRAQFSHR